MKIVMKHLNVEVPAYNRSQDPIFHHASLLKEEELHTTSQPMLKKFIFKGEEESSELDESNTGTYSSEKQTLSAESEDSKSQMDAIRNFSCIKSENQFNALKQEDIKIDVKDEPMNEVETLGVLEIKSEGDKIMISENVTEVLDLTIDDEPPTANTNGHGENQWQAQLPRCH